MEQCSLSGDEVMDDPSDLAKEYPIVEIFHSVQGAKVFMQGYHTYLFDLGHAIFVVLGAIQILTHIEI